MDDINVSTGQLLSQEKRNGAKARNFSGVIMFQKIRIGWMYQKCKHYTFEESGE